MDEVDLAQGSIEEFQTYALQLNRRNREQGSASLAECIDCGGEIPLKRRLAAIGCRRCIECQNQHEKGRRLHDI